MSKEKKSYRYFPLAGDEVRHSVVIGPTREGKSVLMNDVLRNFDGKSSSVVYDPLRESPALPDKDEKDNEP